MKIDDTDILRLLDTAGTTDEPHVFKTLMASDKELAEQVTIMKASLLPYVDAFNVLDKSPFTKELSHRLNSLITRNSNKHSLQQRLEDELEIVMRHLKQDQPVLSQQHSCEDKAAHEDEGETQ